MEIKKNTIFISIASYRDNECTRTVDSLFKNAKYPKNVFLGICQQNKDTDKECVSNVDQYKDNIRIIRLNEYEAQGPTWARYLASTLWNGEEFFMQIDSHSLFSKEWDVKCIDMMNLLKRRGIEKPLLSYYPKSYDDYEKDTKVEGKVEKVTRICRAFFNDRSMISLEGAEVHSLTKDQLVENAFIAGGFLFVDYTFLKDVPFDPRLPYLFVGEEILHSARAWTSGYRIFSPSQNIVYHYYTRKNENKIWTDNPYYSDMHAFNKAKLILELDNTVKKEDIPHYVIYNIEKYGLGTKKTLKEYYQFAGIDFKNKKVTRDFCK